MIEYLCQRCCESSSITFVGLAENQANRKHCSHCLSTSDYTLHIKRNDDDVDIVLDVDKATAEQERNAQKRTKQEKQMNTVAIAQEILEQNTLFLDTETTGLSEYDEIVQVAGVNPAGQVLFNDLIKPTRPISKAATAITNADVENANYKWIEVASALNTQFQLLPVCMYNAVFDLRMIEQTNTYHNVIHFETKKAYDAMEIANRHFHEHLEWDKTYSKFNRLSLVRCCEIAGIAFEGKAHTAIADAKATLELVKFIANDG